MGGDDCDIGLGLSIGGGEFKPIHHHKRKRSSPVQLNTLFAPKIEEGEEDQKEKGKEIQTSIKQGKMESKGKTTHDDGFVVKESSDGSIEEETNSARKKLRLSKEQSFILEESFRSQHILTSAQKYELAKKLNLRLRQVEVWFQNRRARTKLKQTEVDYEFLKKWCENLTSENERLKRELMELRLIKLHAFPQNYLHIQKNVGINICPSCQKISRN